MNTMLSRVTLVAAAVVAVSAAPAGAAGTWARAIGGAYGDTFMCAARTSSGEILVAGDTQPASGAETDAWVVKMNEAGSVLWQRSFGGSGAESVYGVSAAAGGGSIIVGSTYSFGVSGDAWVARLNSAGSVLWQRCYGGSGLDRFRSVMETSDGGFILGGATYSFGSGTESDGWVVKVTSAGDIEWQRRFDGTGHQWINEIRQSHEGGYIAVGVRWPSGGQPDGWVLKIDGLGNIQWERSIGGASLPDTFNALEQLDDHSYLLVGYTSFGVGMYDGLIVKLSEAGTMLWRASLGEAGKVVRFDDITSDSRHAGLLVISGGWGDDQFLGCIDNNGILQWVWGEGRASAVEYGGGLVQTPDGGFIAAGAADLGGGLYEGWVTKTDTAGNIVSSCAITHVLLSPTPGTPPAVTAATPASSALATSATVTVTGMGASSTGWADSFLCMSGPAITSIKSKGAKPGSQASIKGSGFSATAKKNTVYFGKKKAKIKKAKSTLLKVTIPTGLPKGPVDVRVVVGGVTSNTVAFTIK